MRKSLAVGVLTSMLGIGNPFLDKLPSRPWGAPKRKKVRNPAIEAKAEEKRQRKNAKRLHDAAMTKFGR